MGAGDARSGSGVNSARQLAYILNNPFSFIKMMAVYLPQYLSIGNAQMFVTSFAYLGDGAFMEYYLTVLLAVVVFTDEMNMTALRRLCPIAENAFCRAGYSCMRCKPYFIFRLRRLVLIR